MAVLRSVTFLFKADGWEMAGCRQHCPFYWETSSFLRAHYQTSFYVVLLGTGLRVPIAVRKRVSVSVAGGGRGKGDWALTLW